MKESHAFISNKAWEKYKRIVTSFMDQDTGRQDILWAKKVNQMLSHGEDVGDQYYGVEMEALCFYNAFRNWPINKGTVTGELDDENLSVMITREYIKRLGYLNSDGYWDFNWAEDRFVINGITYKPSGDTPVSQVKDHAIVFLLILKRDRDTHLLPESFVNCFAGKNGIPFKDINNITLCGKLE